MSVASVRTCVFCFFVFCKDSAVYNVQPSQELLRILWGDSPDGEGARGRKRMKIPADQPDTHGHDPGCEAGTLPARAL